MKVSERVHVTTRQRPGAQSDVSKPRGSMILWLCLIGLLFVFVYLFASAYRLSSELEADVRKQAAQTDQIRDRLETRETKLERAGPIDINTATREELDLLPDVSLKIADSIIENRPYESIDDLTRASGIGFKRLALIRKHLHITFPETGNEISAQPAHQSN